MNHPISNNTRTSLWSIDPVFLQRWSPRAFTSDEIEEVELLTILEAARWAPSSFNSQPWRFLYSRRASPCWGTYVSLLMDFNATWAAQAAALIFVVSDTQVKDGAGVWKRSTTHSFDAGAAWACLSLQSSMKGWQAHAMAGIHHDKVREALQVPRFFQVEAAVAIGKPGDPSTLPDKLRAREQLSQRRPLEEIAFAGLFQSDRADWDRLDRKP